MSEAPDFLTVEDVLLIHEEGLARYGGGSGIRDAGALESAVAMPQAAFGGQLVHDDLFAMVAAYAFHLAQNQPFVAGTSAPAWARRWCSWISTESRSPALAASSTMR